MAKATFKATSRKLAAGLAVENTTRDFKMIMDEPESLGGTDKGMNPVEALLCALGSCQCIVAAAFARAQGVQFDDLWVDVEGDLDPDGFLKGKPGVRPGFEEIRFTLHMETDEPEEKVNEFAAFVASRCPVEDTLVNGTPVHSLPVVIE